MSKYIVRDGFHVALKLTKQDGSSYERRHEGGEEIVLDDDQAALHLHKLEPVVVTRSKMQIPTPPVPGSQPAA